MGRRVTSGRTVTAHVREECEWRKLLVAVVSRLSTRTLAPTIGQISDDQGNHWLQAVEYFTADHYGVDIWYCESARGGNRPTVTGVCLGYPVRPGTDGMRMTLLEYSGARGFELCDQICQANITGAAATATTNFGLQSNDELAISVIVGNMTSATVPSGWNSRVADVTQRCYVADTLSSGASVRCAIECHVDWARGGEGGRGSHRHLRPAGCVLQKSALGAVVLYGLSDPPCRKGSCSVEIAALPGESDPRQHTRRLHERFDLPPRDRLRVRDRRDGFGWGPMAQGRGVRTGRPHGHQHLVLDLSGCTRGAHLPYRDVLECKPAVGLSPPRIRKPSRTPQGGQCDPTVLRRG